METTNTLQNFKVTLLLAPGKTPTISLQVRAYTRADAIACACAQVWANFPHAQVAAEGAQVEQVAA